jgi:hypothetical protein
MVVWLFIAQFFASVYIKHMCLQLYVKAQVVVPMLSQVLGQEDIERSGVVAKCILNLGTRWMLVVSFTPPAALYPGINPWYPFDRRLNRHRAGLDRAVENRKSPCSTSNQTPAFQPTI